MKKEVILQKSNINSAFEKMKVKGKIDPAVMEKYGFKNDEKTRSTVSYSPSSHARNLPGHVSAQNAKTNTLDVYPYSNKTDDRRT